MDCHLLSDKQNCVNMCQHLQSSLGRKGRGKILIFQSWSQWRNVGWQVQHRYEWHSHNSSKIMGCTCQVSNKGCYTLCVHQAPLCFMQLGRGGYVKTQLSLYPIYFAGDTFQPLWAIFRWQKCIMWKTIEYTIISRGACSKPPRSRRLVYPYWTHIISYKQSTWSSKDT